MYEIPIAPPIPDGPFEPNWHSLEQFRVPDWYQNAKFGIFIHWGPYSVPAFGNEWYARNMYVKGSKEFEHHLSKWGTHDKFGYKDFIPLFKAEKFDPEAWIDLFARAGEKYVVPVAEHHDGFAMYDTALNRWNAKNMGPKRDVVGELSRATRERGLTFGVSNHRAEHWWFMNGGREYASDVNDPAFEDFYGPAKSQSETPSKAFKDDWLARCCELGDKYRPQLFYFDTWAERPPLAPYRKHFAAYYYNRAREWGAGPSEVAINYKNEMFTPRSAVMDVERGQCGDIQPWFWQSDTAVGRKSWCHIEGEDYKSAESIVCDLVDIVSKNGTLLLNIGPRADGTIPEPDTAILEEIGQWLSVNGEAIYGTRPWKVYGEGPTIVPDGHFTDASAKHFTSEDFRFTTRGRDTLYAICLGRPLPGSELLVRSLGAGMRLRANPVAGVKLLGGDDAVEWSRDASGLKVRLPAALPTPYGVTLEIMA